jgi:hypothetical protein
MTVQEIHKELFDDLKNLREKFEYCRKDFKKIALRVCRYPFSKSYVCKTKNKKNLFTVTFTAMKRSGWKKPISNFDAIYSRPEGNYAAALTLDMNVATIYPPHFFKRYRERILKDELISNNDVIRKYFDSDWGFVGAVVNEDFESVFHCFENDDKEEKISFVAVTSQGYCFGEKQGNINIIKTIISEDMLFENQRALFCDMKKAFDEYNLKRYGTSV